MEKYPAQIQEELSDLICLELSGGLDAEAEQRLAQYREKYGEDLVDRVRLVRRLKNEKEFDCTDAYREFRDHIAAHQSRWYNRYWNIAIASAALIILFIGIGLLWSREEKMPHLPHPPVASFITPGHSKAIITLADGKRLQPDKGSRQICRENGTVLKFDSAQAEYIGKAATDYLVYNTITIPAGGEYQLKLSDGTKVWLNAVSSLRFPVGFSGEKREVYLQGEAYFDVSKDSIHPFIVHTSRGNIRVLGTGFNVRDYPEEQKVVATLVEGRIAYQPVGQSEHDVLLEPGGQVEDREGSLPVVRRVDVLLYAGWKDGKYIFENTTLGEIMEVLSRWYDIEVFYKNEEVKNLHFTGDLERYNNIDDFLEFMEIGGNVRFSVRGRTVVIE